MHRLIQMKQHLTIKLESTTCPALSGISHENAHNVSDLPYFCSRQLRM